jgi:nucleotide-binding universal stress UspA family protein
MSQVASPDSDGRREGHRPGSTMSDGREHPIDNLQLFPLHTRRRSPWLLVEVDDSPDAHRALVWALREAARREATVVAVRVLDTGDGEPLEGTARPASGARTSCRDRLEAAVLRAVAETGINGRTRTAILERPVFEALDAAVHGADLVMVGAAGKRLLRPAIPRQPLRRVARGA